MKKVIVALIIVVLLFLIVGNIIVAAAPEEEKKEVHVKQTQYNVFTIVHEAEEKELCYTPKKKE